MALFGTIRLANTPTTFVDITARTRAEEAVRASEEKYRGLFENIDEGYALIELERDENGTVQDFVWRDVNPAFGGPIIKDKLWFFGTFRYQSNDQNVASMWVNLNAGDNTKWTYLPADGKNGRPLEVPIDDGRWKNGSLRLTWQATPRNKFNFFTDYQRICQHCIQGGSSSGQTFSGTIASPEALQRVENRPNSMTQISWTSPVTPLARLSRSMVSTSVHCCSARVGSPVTV